ncbi:hypothetical protein PVK06_028225 [Gossypium arboreum]|uniref:Reverse transcriptase zinc-binding domain-containing protein n=1 Tax=Gossypium arboreum TaxID=29729 RepID=A0ABR0P3R1_GOSAR|nr:hypothetical protein PVK06_028225 [Gossypium arboreum]
MMTHLCFHMNWIVLILRCVCSVSYSVSLNGSNKGFSTLIKEAKQKGLMKGAFVGRERFFISHSFFADDCILFGDTFIEGAKVARNIIKEYEMISCQRVNLDESLIYLGANVDILSAKIGSYLSFTWRIIYTARDLIEDGILWSLWAIRIPAKVKIHAWRLLNNFLPNYCNLNQRTLRVSVDCPLCKAAPENTDHLLWSCDIVQRVWASLQIKIAPVDNALSCKNDFVNTFCLADDLNKQFIAISLWALWYKRNKLIYKVEGDSLTVIKKLKEMEADKSLLLTIFECWKKHFEEVHYLFFPRRINEAAHTLAMEGRRRQYSVTWVDRVLGSVLMIVEKDRADQSQRLQNSL